SEGEPRVLDGVVKVDVDVPLRLDREPQPRVPGDRVEHVVEEADRSLNASRDFSGRPQLQPDRGLLRGSLDESAVHPITSFQASRKLLFSSGRPTVARSAPALVPATRRTRIPLARRASNRASAGRSGRT